MPDPPPQSYAKHLQPLGYGYPLWTPEPPHELLVRRRDGLRIGDVGVIDLENGSFDVFFNICLPRDHPLHRATGVPDNFMPVELDEWDIASFPHAEYPGRVISSSSVTATTTMEPSGETATPCPFTYEFSLASSEGALLILPKGAESYKLRKRQMFKDIATRNAINWYSFAEQHLGRMITRDSLYLITGLYKTNSWSVAAFHQATGPSGSSAQFKASYVGEGNSVTYAWETMRALDWRVGPQIDVGVPNQSVFISGFKIAIREGLLGKRRVEVEIDVPPPRLLRQARFPSSGNGSSSSRSGSLWRRVWFKDGSGGRGPVEQTSQVTHSTKEPILAFSSAARSYDNADTTGQATVNHVPPPLQSLHPSDVFNRYLLSNEPSAKVAITHDSEWGILFARGLLKPEDLNHSGRLKKIMSENYHLISQDGVVSLQTICDTSIRPMDIDDAARGAWKENRLEDAEEILSRQFTRRMGSDHFVFANRALIRARLRHWDAALRDAEMSINIQPSVLAHIARGVSFFGKDKYEFAVEAFNIALRQCDFRDRDILLLIKYIVMYEAGYHAESMAGISDLMERCSAEVKSTCSSAQAEMCVRLARLASKKEDYDRSLQLLSRAQSLGPFLEVPDLEIVSLMCGWRFDNLQFNIYRQKCEVLFVTGRINEALDCFRTIMRDSGEDVRTRRDNAEWITSFIPQCLKSLENLGDNAMASQNYTEAISRYSMALSLGTNTRDGILIKRSKAYAAARAWEGALRDADEVIRLTPRSALGYERRHEALQGMGRYVEAVQTLNDMHSVLGRSADPRTQDIQTLNPPALAIPNRPSPGHYRGSVVEPTVTASQPSATRDLEQQHSVQLGGLITHITTLLGQLGSNAVAGGREQLWRNQLTDVLDAMREQGAVVPRSDAQSHVIRGLSPPGNVWPVLASEAVPDVVAESIQGPLQRQQVVPTNPSEHFHDTGGQRSPSIRAPPELPPVPVVEAPSRDMGLLTPQASRGRDDRQDPVANPVDSFASDDGRRHLNRPEPDDERRPRSRSRSYSPYGRRRHGVYTRGYEHRRDYSPKRRPEDEDELPRPRSRSRSRSYSPDWRRGYRSDSGDTQSHDRHRNRSPIRHERRERTGGSGGGDDYYRPNLPRLFSPVLVTEPGKEGSSTLVVGSQREVKSPISRLDDRPARWDIPAPVSQVRAKPESTAVEEQLRQRRVSTEESNIPYNIQGYLDEFSKALSTEVRMVLGEVGKLREERRAIQHELGYLMMLKSKYGPGGEFDSEWKPPMAAGVPPPPPLLSHLLSPIFPPPPEVRPSWRTVPPRASRRSRKRQDVAPPEPVPEPRQVQSWATWQPDPRLAPTPSPIEPTLLVPDRGSPGLFGPRSPRDSYRG